MAKLWRKFLSDCKGQAAIMFAVMSFPLMMTIGFTVDYAQTSSKRSELQNISDAVALAVVKGMPISNAKGRRDGEDLFFSLIDDASTGLIDIQHTIEFEDTNPYIAKVAISAKQKGTFGNLVNVGDITHRVASRAVNQDPKVELALVVDVSWSMDDPRMLALKVALDEFMNIVEAEVSSDGIDARVSIIPFAGAVNLPANAQYWWSGPGVNYRGQHCVQERDDDDHRVTATTHADMRFPAFAATSKNCPTVKMLPLTTNMLAIRNHIRLVGERPRGPIRTANWGTSIHRGSAWALRALDPAWHSYLGADIRPTPSNGSVRKFAIIMSDGDLYNGDAWTYDPDGGHRGIPTPTANKYLTRACDELKLVGVDVFTIGFKTDANADRRLANCANEGQFLEGDNTTQLISAYRQIAGNIGGKTPRLLY